MIGCSRYLGPEGRNQCLDPDRMFLGLQDPDPDPLVRGTVRIWIGILPLSRKGVERRVGIKKPTQKNQKKQLKTPTKNGVLGFFLIFNFL